MSTASSTEAIEVPAGTPGAMFDPDSGVWFIIGTNITNNEIWQVSGLDRTDTSTAGTTVARLDLDLATANSGPANGAAETGYDLPNAQGLLQSIDIDPTASTTGLLYFVTQQYAGGTLGTGGVYTYNLTTGAITNLYAETGSTDLQLEYIDVDPSSGRYYVTDSSFDNNTNVNTASILTNTLGTVGTPTEFAKAGNINASAPLGITIQNAPTLIATGLTPGVTEASNLPGSGETTRVALFSGITASDIDTPDGTDELAGAQVRISAIFQTGATHQDFLRIEGNTSGTIAASGIAYSYNSATGVLTLSGPATTAEYQAALALVTFSTSGDDVTAFGSAGSRTFAASVFDGLLYSDEVTTIVTVTGINDAPVNSIQGTSLGITEDATNVVLSTTASAISVNDVDADPANQNLTITLSVTQGTLTILTNVGGGIVAGDITGGANGTNQIVITATQNEINATLAASNALLYTPILDFYGADTLTIVTNDQGFTGNDPGLTGTPSSEQDTDTRTINITAVADIVADTLSTAKGVPVTANLITGTNGASADSFENAGRALTAVTQGANGGVTSAADGSVTYTPIASFNGADTFTYTVTSGGVTETANVTVNVFAPPTIAKAFADSVISINTQSTVMTFTITNPAGNPGNLTGVGFNDTLLSGLQIAPTPGLTVSNCGAPTTTGFTAGLTSLMVSGATVATATPCVISVNVRGTLAGTVNNTTTAVTSTNGGNGLVSNTASVIVNNPPTITGATISRQQGSPLANSQIATVNDNDQAENTLAITINGGPAPVTVNGVTVSNVVVDASGNVTADVQAGCIATNATFTLTVTDTNGASATATLTVNVTPNTAPTVGTYANTTLNTGDGTTVSPTGGAPADNGSVATATASAPSFTGTFAVSTATGVVTITSAGPAGSYTVTVIFTDNCGLQTTRQFTLTVNEPADLAITKTASPEPVGSGANLTYTITLTNNGPFAAQNVSVTDPIPANTTLVSALATTNGGGWSIDTTSGVVFSNPTFANGQTTVFTIVVNVTAGTPAGTIITNTATADSTADPTPGNNIATATSSVITCVTPPLNMIAWYSGDNTPRDIAGGNDGTLVGGATYAAGKVGQAFSFPTNPSYVTRAAASGPLNLTGNAVTIDGWINPTTTSGAVYFGKTQSGANDYLLYNPGNVMQAIVNTNTGETIVSAYSDFPTNSIFYQPPTGTWTHIAMTYDGATIKLYANGVQVGSAFKTGNLAGSNVPFNIGGRSGPGLQFNGLIDEVEVFNRALSQSEIQAIHAADSGGKCKPSDLKITKTHSDPFVKGSTGNTYTITVSNDGPEPTTGTTTVTDMLPAGLTATALAGTGWSCTAIPGGGTAGPATLTCSRSDALAAGSSYPPITLTVTAQLGSPATVNNVATASGGGEMDTSDSTVTDPTNLAKSNTATGVTSSSNPSVFGQTVTFTATVAAVAPGMGTPTGTVQFLDAGNPITGCGSVTLSGGTASCITSTLPVGNHTITTLYSGDADFNTSTGSLTGNPQVVNKADTSVGLTSSQNPTVFGEPVTFTASVAVTPLGAGTPTGTIQFLDGATPITGCSSVALTGAAAQCVTSALSVGSHTITAVYSGDGNFNTSTGALTGNPQVVNKADTTTSVTSDANPSVFGQPVTFTATVAQVSPGVGTPTGTVNFLDGGNPIAGCQNVGLQSQPGGQQAQCQPASLSVGNHTITTTYRGDGNFNTSTGSLTGNPQVVTKAGTTLGLTSSQNASVFGESVTFTATISITTPGAGTPTGTIQFLDGGNPIAGCASVVVAANQAQCTTAALAVGNHTITAVYSGDGNFNTSTGSMTGNPQVVDKANASVGLTSSQNPSVFGQGVTFTATVAAIGPGAGTPTGTIQFLDGGSPIAGCTSVTIAGGSAACMTSALSVGNHTITASYSGDGNFNTSSGSMTGNPQVVNKAGTATTLTSSQDPSVFGQSVTFTATVSPVGFGTGTPSGTVQFLDGGTPIPGCTSITMSAGSAACATSALSVGNHTITAQYSGDAGFEMSTGNLTGNPQVVNQAATSFTAVGDTPDPTSVDGQYTVSWTVGVTVPGTGTPTGTVTVSDGTGDTCTAAVGAGSCTLNSLTQGVKTLTFTYSGDTNFAGTTNNATTHTVNCTPNPVVQNSNNSGTGSLRKAVADACSDAGQNTITFNMGAANVTSPISLSSGQIVLDRNVIIQGPAEGLTVRNTQAIGPTSRVFFVGSTATINQLTISGGNTDGSVKGGGILVAGTLNLNDSTLSGNNAVTGGGLITTGAAIANILRSTVTGNSAGFAGGIGTDPGGTINLTQSTVSANFAGNGGSVFCNAGSTINITNSTISGNTRGFGIGGIDSNSGNVTLRGSIVAANDGTADLTGPAGSITSLGYNLIGNPGSFAAGAFPPGSPNANNDFVGSSGTPLDPSLLPLANNGGPTQTMALCVAAAAPAPACAGVSPAIDKGKDFVGSGFDQRGNGPNFVRPFDLPDAIFPNAAGGDGSDIGAYELNNTPPTITAAVGLTRQAGSAGSNSQVATVGDIETPVNTLTMAVNGAAAATVNGVTVTLTDSNGGAAGINPNGTGQVFADIVAACGATNASFTLTVTDGGGLAATATLTVTVTANSAPVLSYSQQTIVAGTTPSFGPATGPADNGSVASIVVTSVTPNSGLILSVNNTTGVVSVVSASAAGFYVVTITATDNCGATTAATFTVQVNCPPVTVGPPTLPNGTVTAPYSQTITASPAGGNYTFAVTSGSLPTGLTLNAATGVLSGTPTATGTFTFTITAMGFGGCPGSRTYSVTIGKADTATTVAASPNPTTYGDSINLTATVASVPPGAGTPTGTVNFLDGGVAVPSCQNVALNGSGVATCAVSSLNAGINKTISAVYSGSASFNASTGTATQTVNKAPLTVTADNKTRVYGQPNPPLTATITGFVLAQNLGNSGVTGSPVVTTNATPTSPVSGSPYAINVAIGSLASANYSFTNFANGQLTITPAQLTVTAEDKTRVFGAVNPPLTVVYTGFVNGETFATSGVTGSPAVSTTATQASPVGTYPITVTAGTLAASNYSFVFADGTLTITIAATTTTITNAAALANPTTVGQAYAVNWTTTPVAPSAGTPTGTVTVSDGTGETCQAAVAVGTCNLTSTTPGAKTITAVYSGDTNFTGSTSQSVPLNVVIGATGNVKQFIAFGTNTNLAGVTVTLTGSANEQTTTNANGDYSFGLIMPGGTYTITPSGLGKTYEPISRTYTNVTTNISGADFIAYDQNGPNAIPREIRAINTVVTPGQPATVPIETTSQGNETYFAFSLNYDVAILGIPTITCGTATNGCNATINTSTPGTAGITITPTGVLTAGVRQIARVTFPTFANTVLSTPVSFGDQPTARDVRNASNDPLPALYRTGFVGFTQTNLGFEGDVVDAAGTSAGGDGVRANDITTLRNIVLGLTIPDPATNQYQRADVSPRDPATGTFGDGRIDSTDVTIGRLYALGTLPPTTAAGPTGPVETGNEEAGRVEAGSGEAGSENQGRVIRLRENAVTQRGRQIDVAIEMNAQGDETAASLTVNFDPRALTYVSASVGDGVPTGSVFSTNANNAEAGSLGILLDSTGVFSAGTRRLFTVTFNVAETAEAGFYPISFDSAPTPRSVSNLNGSLLRANYEDGFVVVTNSPGESTSQIGGRVLTPTGHGLRNTVVTLTAPNRTPRIATTGSAGVYSFANVPIGTGYTLTVASKRYRFAPKPIVVNNAVTEVNLVGLQ